MVCQIEPSAVSSRQSFQLPQPTHDTPISNTHNHSNHNHNHNHNHHNRNRNNNHKIISMGTDKVILCCLLCRGCDVVIVIDVDVVENFTRKTNNQQLINQLGYLQQSSSSQVSIVTISFVVVGSFLIKRSIFENNLIACGENKDILFF